MDLLRKELQRKKEALAKAKGEKKSQEDSDDGGDQEIPSSRLDKDPKTDGGKKKKGKKRKKYLTQRDIRRIEEEEEEERERQRQKKLHKLSAPTSNQQASSREGSQAKKSKHDGGDDDDGDAAAAGGTKTSLSSSEPTSTATTSKVVVQDTTSASITKQLRRLGLVIRYFGEDHDTRLSRLQTSLTERQSRLKGLSELEEFRLEREHRIRNEFLQRDDSATKNSGNQSMMNAASALSSSDDKLHQNNKKKNTAEGSGKTSESSKTADGDNGGEDGGKNNDDAEDDNDQIIYKFLKGLLKEWEQDLSNRPDSVARSVSGRNESKTFKQCKDYIRPLFKLLKSRELEEGLQFHLLNIVNFAKEGEFVKAHDEYMNVAIGRAAWPIGVTMVGIHARSGRAKIEASKVAHVMNSELQRKYLTSVKRLLTYAQKKRPDVDPSKKVQN
mmetsp:Transcript_50775/g.122437  ORF Transcript_50775/g.122437 Transcript_50775/m.122437 type:complete len:442 (-) Transcript_50775:172-1497(-)